jgi:hypothetical protein
MKFFVNGELSNSRLLMIILSLTLVYFVFLSVTSILLYVGNIGFTYSSVVDYYLGSEETFRNPVSYRGLLEASHFHLFSMAIGLLLVNHLTAFTGLPQGLKFFLVLVSFFSGLLDIASGWLIRFSSAHFAYLKIASFSVFQLSFLFLLAVSFFSLRVYNKGKPENGRRHP